MSRAVLPLISYFLSYPPVRIIIASAFLWLSAFTWFKFTLWREPHSAFFNSDHVYDFDYSAFRRDEAYRFVHAADRFDGVSSRAAEVSDSHHPAVCAAFVTVKRQERQYLKESIGSMLQGLHPEERENLYVYLLFANTDPQVHPDFHHPWVYHLTDDAGTYNLSREELEHIRAAESRHDWHEKGLFDYLYVLEKCLADTDAPYIAIFEDDIIFADGWMTRMLNGLVELNHRTATIKGNPHNQRPGPSTPLHRWIYLRLFYTETMVMWTNDDFWFRNMPLAFALGSFAAALILLTLRRTFPKTQPVLTTMSIATLCLISIPAFTALVYMVGKYNIKPMPDVVSMNKNGCCTQGLVYPRAEVPALIRFLRERGRGQTDMLVEDYADIEGLNRYALVPQAIQHIGRHSSRDNDDLSTMSTWAFWFETYDPLRLKREHDEAVQALDWEEIKNGK